MAVVKEQNEEEDGLDYCAEEQKLSISDNDLRLSGKDLLGSGLKVDELLPAD